MNSAIEREEDESVTVEFQQSGLMTFTIPKNEWEEVWEKKILETGVSENLIWDLERKHCPDEDSSDWRLTDVEESL
jgi:hypothetical protein